VLLGGLIFQFLERVPDRQAAELVKYHLCWKLALNLKLGAEGFHPSTLVHFRQRLSEAFGRQCHGCPDRPACVPRDQAHRTIVVGACHEALQQLRREQLSPEFELRMHQRNAIEGTISELL